MSYALIDNATLTGIQRITGDIEIRTLDSVEGDIICLDNMVNAILFYDDILCLDDYKEQYREERKAKFDFITFRHPSELDLEPITTLARDETKKFVPIIRGGEFADSYFKEFFDLLKLNVVCTWDISSSIYYLTLKMLGKPESPEFAKYGQLTANIFNELSDAALSQTRLTTSPILFDSKGKKIERDYSIPWAKHYGGTTGGLTPALENFVSALGWICFKTIYYTFLANHLRADAMLYPVRHAFQMRYLEKAGCNDSSFTASILSRLDESARKANADILNYSRPKPLTIDLPLMTAWAAQKCGNSKDIISLIRELADEPDFAQARELLSDIRRLYDEVGIEAAIKKANKLTSTFDSMLDKIRASYSVPTSSGSPNTKLVHVYNAVAQFTPAPKLPTIDLVPQFVKEMINAQGFCSIYRNLSKDLSVVQQLGKIRDILGSNIKLNSDKASYNPKTEDPNYRKSVSWWKCFM